MLTASIRWTHRVRHVLQFFRRWCWLAFINRCFKSFLTFRVSSEKLIHTSYCSQHVSNACYPYRFHDSFGFNSGDSAGVCHQLIPLLTNPTTHEHEFRIVPTTHEHEFRIVISHMTPSGYTFWIKGKSVYIDKWVRSIIPSKIHIPVAPLLLIPAHTWTLTLVGC